MKMQWHTPLGYRIKDGVVQVDEDGRKTVQRIFREYVEGSSTRQIAARLKADGIPNAQRRVAWTHVTVGKILENSSYAGTGQYPGIIAPTAFGKVQEMREQVRASLGRGDYRPNARERELFYGVLVCGVCGAPYSHLRPRNKGRKNDQAKWKCRNYAYQKDPACAGGFLTDGQAMAICVQAVNWILADASRIETADAGGEEASGKLRELDRQARQKPGAAMEERARLLRERAAEKYRTLKVRDTGQRTAEMYKALQGREELADFDEGLYRRLIREIRVNRDMTVKITFHNGSSVKLKYGVEEVREGS